MIKKNKCLVALACVGSLVPLFAGGPRVKKQDPAVFFWYHFRTSIIENKFPELADLTLFPFELEKRDGTVDSVNKKGFEEMYRSLLDSPTGKNGKTMRALISEKDSLTEQERSTLKKGDLQIGIFRFRTLKNKCWFVGSMPSSKKNIQETKIPIAPPKQISASQEDRGSSTVNDSDSAPAPSVLKKEPPSSVEVEKTTSPNRDTVFRFYWLEFRRAVMDNNVAMIKEMTRFPFETKGPLEDDKIKKYRTRDFDLLWPRLLEADPHSWGPLRDSMKELIIRREEPRVEEIATESTGEVQLGVFVFRKIKNRWRFTRAMVIS